MDTTDAEPLSLSEDLLARVQQRILEADALSLSSISTNSTASDVIGPGRTLGMAYKFAGKKLEASLNKCFEKAGFGPQAASRRIQQRMAPPGISSRSGSSAVIAALGRLHKYMVRRDCLKLLDYAQSDVLANQLQALDEIVDLSLKHHYIRELLIKLDIIRTLARVCSRAARETENPALQSRSRRALICFEDTHANTLMREVEYACTSPDPVATMQYGRDYCNSLLQYITGNEGNANIIQASMQFLISLSVKEASAKMFLYLTDKILPSLNSQLMDVVGQFEWNMLDMLLVKIVKPTRHRDTEDLLFILSHVGGVHENLEVIFSHTNYLPETTSVLRQLLAPSTIPGQFFGLSDLACAFVKSFLKRKNLQDFDINSFDHSAFHTKYKSMSDEFSYMKGPFLYLSLVANLVVADSIPIRALVPGGLLDTLCCRVAEAQLEHWDEDLHNHIQVITNRNRYGAGAFFRAFAQVFRGDKLVNSFDVTEPFQSEMSSKTVSRGFTAIRRHRDKDGCLLRVCKQYFPQGAEPQAWHCRCGSKLSDDLRWKNSDIIYLRLPRQETFAKTGHHPLLAGRGKNGKEEYIVMSPGTLYPSQRSIGLLQEASRKPRFFSEHSRAIAADEILIPVLAWDPDRSAGHPRMPNYGVDSTGPVWWVSGGLPKEISESSEAERCFEGRVSPNYTPSEASGSSAYFTVQESLGSLEDEAQGYVVSEPDIASSDHRLTVGSEQVDIARSLKIRIHLK